MTIAEKQELISCVKNYLNEIIKVEPEKPKEIPPNKKVEMLTIKECTQAVEGISEHTIRQLVAQGKLSSVRAGTGHKGKILVSKAALLEYFVGISQNST